MFDMNRKRQLPQKVVDCATITSDSGKLLTQNDIDVNQIVNPDESLKNFDWNAEKQNPKRENIWLSIRSTGIGGSEAAILNGTSGWANSLDLYHDKINSISAVQNKNDVAKQYLFDFGHAMESFVANQFVKMFDEKYKDNYEIKFSEKYGEIITITSAEVFRDTWMYRNPKHTFMIADVDFIIRFNLSNGKYLEGIFECKTSSPYYIADKWANGFPEHYNTQVRHYMAVNDYDFFVIACASDNNSNNYYAHLGFRDEHYEKELIQCEEAFWKNNVMLKIPPITQNINLLSSLKNFQPPSEEKTIDLTGNPYVLKQAQEYFEKRKEMLKYSKISDEFKEMAEIAKSNIAVVLGNKKRALFSVDNKNYELIFSETTSESFTKKEQKKLLIEYPELEPIFKQFTIISEKKDYKIKPVKQEKKMVQKSSKAS